MNRRRAMSKLLFLLAAGLVWLVVSILHGGGADED